MIFGTIYLIVTYVVCLYIKKRVNRRVSFIVLLKLLNMDSNLEIFSQKNEIYKNLLVALSIQLNKMYFFFQNI